jgi:hypothetical protein
MRGVPKWNFPAFDAAEAMWREAGHQPFSPAQINRALKYSPEDGTSLRHVIHMDMACILSADAIAMLPGWEQSSGSTIELALAQFLGLPVYDALSMERIFPKEKPWNINS